MIIGTSAELKQKVATQRAQNLNLISCNKEWKVESKDKQN